MLILLIAVTMFILLIKHKLKNQFPVIDPITLTSDDGWILTIPATSRLIHIKSPTGELSVGYEYDPGILTYEKGNEWIYHAGRKIVWVDVPTIRTFKISPAAVKQLNRHFSTRATLP